MGKTLEVLTIVSTFFPFSFYTKVVIFCMVGIVINILSITFEPVKIREVHRAIFRISVLALPRHLTTGTASMVGASEICFAST